MDLKLNENHDIFLDGNDLAIVDELDEAGVLKQRLSIKLQFLLGEWFLNTNIGIPYTQYIFESNFNDIDTIYAIFRAAINEIEDVKEINKLDINIDRDNKILNISLLVNQNINIGIEI
jgi:hypothetical protein